MIKKICKKFVPVMVIVLGCAGSAYASPSADIYVLRLGDGSTDLDNRVPATIMHYNSSGTLLNSWDAPYDANDADARITVLGENHLYGGLRRSQDGNLLVFGGSDAPTAGSLDRNVIAAFSLSDQNFDISTRPDRGQVRSVVTEDGSAYWHLSPSSGGGLNYVEHGETDASNISPGGSRSLARVKIIDDVIWKTRSAGSSHGLYYLESSEEGVPTEDTDARVQVLGEGRNANSGNYHDFFFLDENTLFMSEGGFALAVWELNEDTGLYDQRDITVPGNALINDPELARMELALSPFSGPDDEEITIYLTGSKTLEDNSIWSVTWNTDTKTFDEATKLAFAGDGYAFAGIVAIPESGTVGLLFGASAVSAVLMRRRFRS